MIIKLTDDFFVEVDELNHTLKQRYTRNGKDGKQKEAEKTHGYFSNLNDAIEKFIKIKQLEATTGINDILRGYVKAIQEINTRTVDEVINAVGREQ